MKTGTRYQRLPIPVGFLILTGILLGSVFLINKLRSLNNGAATESSPRQIRITNTTSSSFVVSWITQDKATGLVESGETTSLGSLEKDTRDKNRNVSEKFQTHYVLVDNLKSETKYYFRIISAGASYDNFNKLFEATTGPAKTPSDNDIAQGKILNSNKEPAPGALVYLSITNAITQSAITDSQGNWMIPLATARDVDLSEFSAYDRNAQVEELFVQGDSETATATLTTGNDNPVPDIVLGQTYDFLNQLPQATTTPFPPRQNFAENLNNQSSSTSSFGDVNENQNLTITFPAENEKINSLSPEFFGTGPKGQVLKVQIESEQTISFETSVDQKGKWTYSTKTLLSPGSHKITVYYTDSNGFVKKVARSFTILAAGTSELPSFTATPSGQTITPSPKISPTPTTAPTSTPTPLLTAVPSPFSAPSVLSPTAIPTEQYRTTVPSTESGTYRSGNVLPTRFFFGTGLIILLIGVALVLF